MAYQERIEGLTDFLNNCTGLIERVNSKDVPTNIVPAKDFWHLRTFLTKETHNNTTEKLNKTFLEVGQFLRSKLFVNVDTPARFCARALFDQGKIAFSLLRNDIDAKLVEGSEATKTVLDLVRVKNVFSAQLPRMPKEYITRVVFCPRHSVFAMRLDGELIGGVAFRPFLSNEFAELVFCAVRSEEQVKGFGSLMMAHFKEHVKTLGARFLTTYADNFAIGFFKKQGFSGTVQMHKEQYRNHIKHYDGSTLMECALYNNVDYTQVDALLLAEQEKLAKSFAEVQKCVSVFVHKGNATEAALRKVLADAKTRLDALYKEDRLSDSRWVALLAKSFENTSQLKSDSEHAQKLNSRIAALLKHLRADKNVWPFLQPVDQKQVVDYYQRIPEAMDLATMTEKFRTGKYTAFDQFDRDFRLVVDNCRVYNDKNSNYVRCADKLEKTYQDYLKEALE